MRRPRLSRMLMPKVRSDGRSFLYSTLQRASSSSFSQPLFGVQDDIVRARAIEMRDTVLVLDVLCMLPKASAIEKRVLLLSSVFPAPCSDPDLSQM